MLQNYAPDAWQGHKPLWILAMAMIFTGLVFSSAFAAPPFKATTGQPVFSSVLAFYAGAILWVSFWILGILLSTGTSPVEGSDSRSLPRLSGESLSLWPAPLDDWKPGGTFQRTLFRLTLYLALVQIGFTIGSLYRPADTPARLFGLFRLFLIGICAFSAILIGAAGSDRIESLQALGRNRPLLGICQVIFLLSWLGLPPLAGFWIKLKILTLLFKLSAPGLLLPLFLTAVALWATLLTLWPISKILKTLYHNPDSASGEVFRPLPLSPRGSTQAVIILLAFFTLSAGFWGAHTLSQTLFPLTYLKL